MTIDDFLDDGGVQSLDGLFGVLEQLVDDRVVADELLTAKALV